MSTEVVSDSRLERYRPYLIGLARVQLAMAGPVRNKVDASDLVQGVLLKAHTARGQFRGRTAEEFAAWLRRILANRLIDEERHFLRKKRDAALEEAYRETIDESAERILKLPVQAQTSPSQHLARHERQVVLAEALNHLPEDQRTAVELRYLAEWSLADTSRFMDRTRPSVAGLLRRGLKTLREDLETLR